MYKLQVRLQKLICLMALVSGTVMFVYSLGMLTDLYDMLYSMIPDPDELDKARVAGARIYYDMQPFNRYLLYCGIGLIVLSCVLFLTNTHKRRRYYVGNYIATGLNVVCQLAAAWYMHVNVAKFKHIYLTTVDFAQLERRLSRVGTYTDSTFWFDVHTFVFGLAILACILLVANMIWKFSLMKKEQHLIDAGKGVAA